MNKSDISKVEFIFPKLIQIWEKAPESRPASMSGVRCAHDLWDWCDERLMDFDDLETYLSMFIIEKLSKFFVLSITIKNGTQEIKNVDENISVSGFSIISSLSEMIKISENMNELKNSSVETIRKTVLKAAR
jgi:hypothetical protein